jgi:hypothetical protein
MGFQMTLMLNADGSGEFDGDAIRFSTQGDKLTVTQNGTSNTYTYILSGNSLKLSGGDLDQPITFTRQGATTPNQAVEPAAAKSQPSTTLPKNLIGVWSGYNETLEFKNSGECVYRGQAYRSSVSGNIITLETTQGNFLMEYAVTGNQLNLTVNGQKVVYTKSGTTNPTTSTAQSGRGNLDMTLVGKWCYMNVSSSYSGGSSTSECITLKADGTYEYYSESSRSVNTNTVTGGTASQNSDQGTWWTEGNRIHYNSRSSGQGSYQLEKRNHPKNVNDPMIVLDGRTYVTATLKNPW